MAIYHPLTETQFNALLPPIRPALVRYAASRVGLSLAEDLVQDAILVALQTMDRFDPLTGQPGLLQFLVAHVRNLYRGWLHRTLPPQEVLLPPEEVLRLAELGEPPDLSSHAYQALKETLYSLIERAQMSALQEQCVHLWLDNHTQEDISAYLGVTQQMVSRHIQAAAAKLRNAHGWETEVEPEVWREFWEEVDKQRLSVYEKPYVWDRRGNVEQRTRRAVRFAREDERERLLERRAA